MNDEHVLALVEAVHGADFNAVHVLAADAGVVHNVGHVRISAIPRGLVKSRNQR